MKNLKTGRIKKPDLINTGYLNVDLYFNNKRYHKLIHRLVAEAFLCNREGKRYVDHINGITTDNSLFNLRWCTPKENSQNAKISIKNTSGVRGICFDIRKNKWRARITIDYKSFHLGFFDDLEEAKIVRQAKAKEVHGVFLNACEK